MILLRGDSRVSDRGRYVVTHHFFHVVLQGICKHDGYSFNRSGFHSVYLIIKQQPSLLIEEHVFRTTLCLI